MGRTESCRSGSSMRSSKSSRGYGRDRDDMGSESSYQTRSDRYRRNERGGRSKSSCSVASGSQATTMSSRGSSRYSSSYSSQSSRRSSSSSALETASSYSARGDRRRYTEERSEASSRTSPTSTPRTARRGARYEVEPSECDTIDEEERKTMHFEDGRVGITYGLGDAYRVDRGPGQARWRRWHKPYEADDLEPDARSFGPAGRPAAGLGTSERTLRQHKTTQWHPHGVTDMRSSHKVPLLIMPPEARGGRVFTQDVPRYDKGIKSVAHDMFQPPPRVLQEEAHFTAVARHAGEDAQAKRVYSDITRAEETRDGVGRMTKAERISWKTHVYNNDKGKKKQPPDERDDDWYTDYDRDGLFMTPEEEAKAMKRQTRREWRQNQPLEARLKENANRFRGDSKATTHDKNYRRMPSPPPTFQI